MTKELEEKIRDTISLAYQIGFTHKSAGNMAYLEVENVLNALMDSIILADKVEIPKPDYTIEVPADNEEDIVWHEYHNGCVGCICCNCIHGQCGEDCKYSGEKFNCTIDHGNEVIKECKHFEEME